MSCLRIASPERILGLQRGDGMHAMRAPNGARRRFGKAEIAHFALLHQIRHGADRVFNRRFRVHAMLVVKIDHFHVQALERSLAARANIFGASIHSQEFSIGRSLIAELGGEHYFLAPALDRLADQHFILERAVHVGGVQKIHSAIEREVNGCDGFGVVGGAVKFRHAHASQTHAGNFQAERA